LVLPRPQKFAGPKDFYKFYQDFYHCTQPAAGEVQIIEPATVVLAVGGWRLQVPGVLEVIVERRKTKTADVIVTKEQPPAPKAAVNVTPCSRCGTLIEAKYGFCWQCGSDLSSGINASLNPSEASADLKPDLAIDFEDDEQTVQHEGRPGSSNIFGWVAAKAPQRHPSSRGGSVLKLFAVGLIGLVSLSLALFLLTRSSTEVATVTSAQTVTPNQQPEASPANSQAPTQTVDAEPVRQPTPLASPGEYELKKLRERRIAAKQSEGAELLALLARTEKKYPKDYRFPYERAKLVIKVQKRTSRTEAFAALSLAVEKAINTGKANEMLENLRRDSRGDFQKLASARREWQQLQEALRTQNTTVLSEKMGL
jgi:hypothetical protein